MPENPYQPPVAKIKAHDQPFRYTYQSIQPLAKWLSGLLILSAILTAILTAMVGLLDVAAYIVIPGFAAGDFIMEGTALSLIIAIVVLGLGGGLVCLVCMIMFLIWTHRSTSNAHALAQGLKITPGWAVGHWFIPILNLFRPYQNLCQVFLASDSRDSGSLNPGKVPAFFPLWWFCWIVGNIASRIETRAAFRDWDLGAAALPITIIASVFGVGAAILAAKVVRQTTRVQDLHWLAAHAPPETSEPNALASGLGDK